MEEIFIEKGYININKKERFNKDKNIRTFNFSNLITHNCVLDIIYHVCISAIGMGVAYYNWDTYRLEAMAQYIFVLCFMDLLSHVTLFNMILADLFLEFSKPQRELLDNHLFKYNDVKKMKMGTLYGITYSVYLVMVCYLTYISYDNIFMLDIANISSSMYMFIVLQSALLIYQIVMIAVSRCCALCIIVCMGYFNINFCSISMIDNSNLSTVSVANSISYTISASELIRHTLSKYNSPKYTYSTSTSRLASMTKSERVQNSTDRLDEEGLEPDEIAAIREGCRFNNYTSLGTREVIYERDEVAFSNHRLKYSDTLANIHNYKNMGSDSYINVYDTIDNSEDCVDNENFEDMGAVHESGGSNGWSLWSLSSRNMAEDNKKSR